MLFLLYNKYEVIFMNEIKNSHLFLFSTETPFFTHIVDGDDYVAHAHLHYEIFYILSGTIVHILNGESRTLSVGDTVFLSPNDVHSFVRPSNAVHRDIIFTESFFQTLLSQISYTLEDFHKKANKSFHLSDEKISILENLLKNYLSFYFSQKQESILISHTVLSLLFSNMLLTESKNVQQTNNLLPEWLTTVIERFNNPVLIQQGLHAILDGIHYNKTYVNRTFKKYFDASLSDYLTKTRLNYALYYLKNTKYTNEEISNMLGFSSPSYFYKIFKKHFNDSPNAYRKH